MNFYNDGGVLIEPNGTLIIEDNVTIGGNNGTKIIVNGNINISQEGGVTFENLGISPWGGIFFNHEGYSISLNYVTLENSGFENYSSLTIQNSMFNNCHYLYSYNSNLSIGSSNFINSWLHVEDQTSSGNYSFGAMGCNFTNNGSIMVGIDLWNYDKYQLFSNSFEGFVNAIQILNSGWGLEGNHNVWLNTISNCSGAGLSVYNSATIIKNNTIQNNNNGVVLYDRSNITLVGDGNDSQEILDNIRYEVYAAKNSFPVLFWHNEIIDEDNEFTYPGYPLLYYSGTSDQIQEGLKSNLKDIRYNCWGHNFHPNVDLYPVSYFSYQPYWCPSENISEDPEEEAEVLYIEANNDFETENYIGAEYKYKQIINDFPKTRFSEDAMKKLFALEKFIGTDYDVLKLYYTTEDSIVSDTNLNQLGKFLASKCEIKSENWPAAIEYYENQILNPISFEDSIFSLVDLGYTYILMENLGYKNSYEGKLKNQIPVSKYQYILRKDYLLSLLPGKLSREMTNKINSLENGKLLQNVPNPFTEKTQIWYKLENEATVQINIYSYTGQLMNSINVGSKTKGSHYIDFDANRLINGIYFYTLAINGQTTDSKKMTIMK